MPDNVNVLQDSRWIVGTLDVIPVEMALPEGLGMPGPDHSIDWQVCLLRHAKNCILSIQALLNTIWNLPKYASQKVF